MKIKTNELTGPALDWAVAKCHGNTGDFGIDGYRPSLDWSQGGPIIAREKIDLLTEKGSPESWLASVARYQNGMRLVGWRLHQYGHTPLVAAMRCYVASKLGDEVDVPEGLS